MMKLLHLIAPLAALCNAGCAVLTSEPWPTAGSGGFAELLPIDDARMAAFNDRLNHARESGAASFAAADLATAETLLIRIRREVAGGLAIDAESDASGLERLLKSFEYPNAVAGRGRAGTRRS
jgi:hypothetical protein